MNTTPLTPINDGGPAFPCEVYICPQDTEPSKFTGMSLRDWFAGQAMTAIISSVYCTPETGFKEVSGNAYAQADAMLAAREVKP